jgi:uncharacterized damage-inducible protein DinB
MATSSFGSVAGTVYPDLDNEVNRTRRMLELFPDGQNDWRPHEKSMGLARLASHVAELPRFATAIVTTDSMDFMKGEYVSHSCENKADILDLFDSSVDSLRAALAAADAESLARPWTLRKGDYVLTTGPKGDLVRDIALNHMVHHRAQLGVYYRLLGVPLPGLYGPSADEA